MISKLLSVLVLYFGCFVTVFVGSETPTATSTNDILVVLAVFTEQGGELFITSLDGINTMHLSEDSVVPIHYYDVSWSPDGQRLIFASNRLTNNDQIYLMDVNSLDITQITYHTSNAARPVWSPNGERIIYTLDEVGLCINHIDEMEEVCPGASIDGYTSTASAVWSPNGQQIAFEVNCCRENTDIAVVNSDGSNIRYLTNLQSVESSGERPKWSPDGQRILFTQGGEGNREIFIINADGSNLINLSNHPNDDYDPSWSPNGNQIVFTSNRDGSYQIYQINVDGSNLNRLTEVDSDNYSPRLIPSYTPSWSPNGTQIAFVHYGEIYVVSIDGTGLSRVTNLDELGFERIGIGGVRWLPNGQGLIFVLSYQSSSTDPGSRDIRWVNIACLNEPEGCTADDTLIVLNSQSVLDFDIYPNSNNPQQIIP